MAMHLYAVRVCFQSVLRAQVRAGKPGGVVRAPGAEGHLAGHLGRLQVRQRAWVHATSAPAETYT